VLGSYSAAFERRAALEEFDVRAMRGKGDPTTTSSGSSRCARSAGRFDARSRRIARR
jgi:hypothetical protein